ncbi:MAG: cytochrome P450 [Sphingobium phenoxybenzoativorans]
MTTQTASAMSGTIPPHIPKELVRDVDIFSIAAVDGDIHLGWHALHDGPDAIYTPRNGGHWIFTRAEDIHAIYRNHKDFSNEIVAVPPVVKSMRFAPAEVDPPELDQYRRALAPAFMPKSLARYEQIARDLAIELIEAFRAKGQCEFQADVARHLPIRVFLGMMDLPAEDAPHLMPTVEDQIRNPDPTALADSFQAMLDYLDSRIEDRRRNPGSDLITQIINSDIDGQKASREQVLSMSANLMFAGLDTVVAAMGFAMRFLATHPEHRQELRDHPEIIPDAVEELLRYHGITNLARVARHEVEVGDVTLGRGDLIVLATTLYGLDERRFPEPEKVDFRRADKAHLIFGSGVHRCLGSHLARTEMRVLLEEWFARIPEFTLVPGEDVKGVSGRNNSIEYVPLRWDAQGAEGGAHG